ncbi:PREDICTED: eukaryotic translation initiation factor 5B [Prunus dulcis]|uniref:PREDICTED: eukaryotic translation initiation factor 5B n=1 Tax=Prunus dulcis TaxID=3755 RepID=A0A5E4ELG5_PRUDU|nr:PREDICTED: eukaryotic translation initiation factor 5B [Prunus dulcis]
MESDRPHRTKSNSSISGTTSTTTSELFICFTTSRLSSSSMKLSSKSLLSPGRAREPSQISLSSSLSRRLRTSGSIKGGQASPMFPSNGGTSKKRGVKTKKQGKKMRIISRSKRSRGSEASFRKPEQNQQSTNNTASQSQELYNRDNSSNNFQGLHFQNHQINNNNQQECLRHRNQRWVHLPLTICEALRAFGSEFNCLIPNRSSCLASDDNNNKEKEENKGVRSESGGSSCGAVFARWFVALQDGDGKGREIELMVGEDQERTERSTNSSSGHSQRRQVFEGIEFKEDRLNESVMEEEEAGRVSICVPPKNALLLMRCRSDPVKMAALANRFWEMPAAPQDEEVEDEEEKEDKGLTEKAQDFVEEQGTDEVLEKVQNGLETEVAEGDGVCEKWVCDGEEHGDLEEVEKLVLEEKEDENPEKRQQLYDEVEEIEEKAECQQEAELEEEEEQELDVTQQALSEECCVLDVVADPEILEFEENDHECEATEQEQEQQEEEKEEEVREVKLPIPSNECVELEEEEKTEAEVADESTEEETETVTQDRPEPVSENPKNQLDSGSKRAVQNSVLPDCLLLMMCEPKLSMEVSKETWVCTTDFIRCLPERHVKKVDAPDEAKKRVSIDSNPAAAPAAQPVIQPPRSSCSFPVQAGPVSMATMIGQKLVGSTAYEPFVLTRCKSEPMRSAGKLAAAETCFWKNRKMEPHRRAAMGVGAAGVGF